MADIDWSDLPRLVIALEYEPTPIEIITIAAWPYITTVIPLDIHANTVLVPIGYYLTTTFIVPLDYFLYPEPSVTGYYVSETVPIPMEFQPLPIPESIRSSASINIIYLDCPDVPIEYWG